MTGRHHADAAPDQCLNCGAAVSRNFCAVCGQETQLHELIKVQPQAGVAPSGCWPTCRWAMRRVHGAGRKSTVAR